MCVISSLTIFIAIFYKTWCVYRYILPHWSLSLKNKYIMRLLQKYITGLLQKVSPPSCPVLLWWHMRQCCRLCLLWNKNVFSHYHTITSKDKYSLDRSVIVKTINKFWRCILVQDIICILQDISCVTFKWQLSTGRSCLVTCSPLDCLYPQHVYTAALMKLGPWAQYNSSAGKDTCCQNWQPKFSPQAPHGRRDGTSQVVLWHPHAHSGTHGPTYIHK